MKLVIEIDDVRYKDIQRIASVQLENYHFKTAEQIIANGTPLPKGHGRLVDEQNISDYVHSHIQEINTGYGDLNSHTNRILRMIESYIDNAPTIIEADKAESEDKLDGDPIDTDKTIEHYEGTLEVLKGVGLEVDG